MNDRVSRVLFSGGGNPTAALPPSAVSEVDAAIRRLDDAPDDPDLANIRPECWPSPKDYAVYVFELEPRRLVFVAGPIVRLVNRRLWDRDHVLTRLAEKALREGLQVVATDDCRDCGGGPLGDLWKCGCDSPAVEPWNHTATVSKNNCYSYAFRKLWCEAQGSTPGDILPEPDGLAQLKQLIEGDGWKEVHKSALSPGTGQFIALLIGQTVSTNYHFVRLDGQQWTHKVSSLLASACDAAGRTIPWNDLESADFNPWWTFHTYYQLCPGATLNHCLP